MRRFACILAGCGGFFLVVSASAIADDASSLPRYALPVGRQLSYSGQSTFTYQNGSFNTVDSYRLTVVGENTDGSRRILVRSGENEVQNRAGQPTSQPSVESEDVSYTQVNIFPDGRVVSAAGGWNAEAPPVLPPLPVDQKEMSATWKREPKFPGETDVFHSGGPAVSGQWTMSSSSEGTFQVIYGMNSDQTYHFDDARGVVTEIDTHNQQDYGFHGTGNGTLKLDSDQMLPADQVGLLAKESATVMAAEADLDKKMDQIGDAPHASDGIVAAAKAALTAASASVSNPELKLELDGRLGQIDANVKSAVETADRIAAVKDKPAFEFSANDMAGQPHKLSDYRGKVVVLDFWYRGCGWCMRAMPDMKKVADDFKDKPVVVLGMNTDEQAADAKFVIDAMKLNYQTLSFTMELAKKFNVEGYPSLLVIDGKGIVREFDEGYSPTLRADLDKKIQGLLDGSGAAAAAR